MFIEHSAGRQADRQRGKGRNDRDQSNIHHFHELMFIHKFISWTRQLKVQN